MPWLLVETTMTEEGHLQTTRSSWGSLVSHPSFPPYWSFGPRRRSSYLREEKSAPFWQDCLSEDKGTSHTVHPHGITQVLAGFWQRSWCSRASFPTVSLDASMCAAKDPRVVTHRGQEVLHCSAIPFIGRGLLLQVPDLRGTMCHIRDSSKRSLKLFMQERRTRRKIVSQLWLCCLELTKLKILLERLYWCGRRTSMYIRLGRKLEFPVGVQNLSPPFEDFVVKWMWKKGSFSYAQMHWKLHNAVK